MYYDSAHHGKVYGLRKALAWLSTRSRRSDDALYTLQNRHAGRLTHTFMPAETAGLETSFVTKRCDGAVTRALSSEACRRLPGT